MFSNELRSEALDIFSKFGMGKPVVRLHDGLFGSFDIPDTDLDGEKYYDQDFKGDILVPIVQGQHGFNTYKESILAYAFLQRGYRPIIPICRTNLPICFNKTTPDNESGTCDMCEVYSDKMFDELGLRYQKIDSIVADVKKHRGGTELPDDPMNVSYSSIPISSYAVPSARRFLKKFHIDLEDRYEREVYRRFLSSAKILVDVAEKIIADQDIQAVIAHNVVYIYGGIFLKVAEKHGIPARTTGIGYWKDQTIRLGDQYNVQPFSYYTDRSYSNDLLSDPLSDEESERLDGFMEKRFEGVSDGISYIRNTSEGMESDFSSQVGIFVNLIWDGSLAAEDRAIFEDSFEWIDFTINNAAEFPQTKFIIKPHPAEAFRTTNEKIKDWIEQNYESLPENVEVLPPETDVNPYVLMENIDKCVVWNSTVGLEACYKSVPTVVVGDTHYMGFGFTFDPEDKKSYLELVSRDDLEMTDEMTEKANRYMYMCFFDQLIDFPFYETDEESGSRLLPVHESDISPGNENIDKIVEAVIEDKPVS